MEHTLLTERTHVELAFWKRDGSIPSTLTHLLQMTQHAKHPHITHVAIRLADKSFLDMRLGHCVLAMDMPTSPPDAILLVPFAHVEAELVRIAIHYNIHNGVMTWRNFRRNNCAAFVAYVLDYPFAPPVTPAIIYAYALRQTANELWSAIRTADDSAIQGRR